MQRPVVINNILRTSTLARRLSRRQSASPGVIELQTQSTRRATAALPAQQRASELAAIGTRFAVARAMPAYGITEPGAQSAMRQSSDRGSMLAPAAHRHVASSTHSFATDVMPRAVGSSHVSGQRRAGSESSVNFTSGVGASESGAPAARFRISRRSVPATQGTPLMLSPTREQSARIPSRIAPAADDMKAQPAEARRDPLKEDDTSTARRFVVSRRPPDKLKTTGDRVRDASAVSGPRAAKDNLSRAGVHPRPAGFTAAEHGRAHRLLSVNAKSSNASPAPPASQPARVKGSGSAVVVARKYKPKRAAFSLEHSLLQRKSLSGDLSRREASQGATVRRSANVMAAAPSIVSSTTAGKTVAMSPPQNGSEQSVPVERRPAGNSTGNRQNDQPLTILRKAVTASGPAARRVESHTRSDDSHITGTLMRKAEPPLRAEGQIDVTRHAGPLVMRQAATRDAAHEGQAASSETAGHNLTGAQTVAPGTTQTPEIDIAQLAEQVSRIISRRLSVERERRGLWK